MNNKLIFSIIVFFLLFSLIFIIRKNREANEQKLRESAQRIERRKITEDSLRKENEYKESAKREERERFAKLQKNAAEKEAARDLIDSYINDPSIKIDVAILIVDNNNKSVNSISSKIASLYRHKGHSVTNSLFSNTFLRSNYLADLMNANSQTITKLRLPSHTNYIVVGKYFTKFEDGENTKYICRASLDISIISCLTKSQIDGFKLSTANGFDDRDHAEDGAIEKIIENYNINHVNF